MPSRSRLIALVCLIAVALGIGARFYHLAHKVYWEDEIVTSLHALGSSEDAAIAAATHARAPAALLAILHPATVTATPLRTVELLRAEDSQHPPLYYVLAQTWMRAAGTSTWAIRALSALIGVLSIGAAYWLCREIFADRDAAAIAAALVALSPIGVLFAQEAREYELWLLLTMVTTALFARALRVPTRARWMAYGAALAVTLWTYPLAGLTAAGYLAAACALPIARRTKGAAVLATVLGCAAFAPWAATMLGERAHIDSTMGLTASAVRHGSRLEAVKAGLALTKLDFADFDLGSTRHAVSLALSLLGLLLAAVAGVRLVRERGTTAVVLVAVLAGSALLPLVALDAVAGTQLLFSPRYALPYFLAVDLALAAALATGLRGTRRNAAVWTLAAAAVVGLRVASIGASAAAPTWWNKWNEQSPAVAHAIDRASHPLLVSTEYVERPMSLAEDLDPRVRLVLRAPCSLCAQTGQPQLASQDLPSLRRYSDVFAIGPSPQLERLIRAHLEGSRTTYHCIDDSLQHVDDCAHGPLRMWPAN